MQLTESQKILRKIEALLHNLADDQVYVSALEKELLRSYIIRLYDMVAEEESRSIKPVNGNGQKGKESPEPHQNPTARASDPVIPAQPAPPSPPQTEQSEVKPTATISSNLRAELRKLVENTELDASAKHIGERLSRELRKTIGLNEKLRYSRELFGGDQIHLMTTLDAIDSAGDLDKAFDVIEPIASDHSWMGSASRESATDFLALLAKKFAK